MQRFFPYLSSPPSPWHVLSTPRSVSTCVYVTWKILKRSSSFSQLGLGWISECFLFCRFPWVWGAGPFEDWKLIKVWEVKSRAFHSGNQVHNAGEGQVLFNVFVNDLEKEAHSEDQGVLKLSEFYPFWVFSFFFLFFFLFSFYLEIAGTLSSFAFSELFVKTKLNFLGFWDSPANCCKR